MDGHTIFIIAVIAIAYLFDFTNGAHDAANAIATIVATKVLTPLQAVVWAAFFNFIAFLVFNLMVAETIGAGLIDTSLVDPLFIFAALIGAISWNLLTWYYGLPSSSSHALIGGLAGVAIVKGGIVSLKPLGFIKVALGLIFSPVIGLLFSLIITRLLMHMLADTSERRLSRIFKGFQLGSSALLSLAHAGNDAQKTMGIIAILLFSSSWLTGPFYVPFWVELSCYAMISLGTLVGGWRIVHTMGKKITVLNPLRGTAAETGAAAIIFVATEWGVPVSTTHTVTGSIAGVGLANGLRGSHWPTLMRIAISWLLAIPLAGLLSGVIWSILG